MLYPTAGSRLFIASAADPAAVGSAWVEIGETEALGLLGGTWGTQDATHMGSRDADGTPITEIVKTILQPSTMQIVLGNDPADPGQLLLWQGYRSAAPFSFRLLFPAGVAERQWAAQIITVQEVFDTANGAIKLQADLIPTTKIFRSDEET